MPQTTVTNIDIERAAQAKAIMERLEALRDSYPTTNLSADDAKDIDIIDDALDKLSEFRARVVDLDSDDEDEDIETSPAPTAEEAATPVWAAEPEVPNLIPSDEPDEIIDPSVTTVSTVTAPLTMQFAPERPPLKGTFQVCCIVVKWNDNDGPRSQAVINASREVANAYQELSSGLFKLQVSTKTVAVNLAHKGANLYKAKDRAITKVNQNKKSEGKYDYYVLFHNNVRRYSNAAGRVAYMRNTLPRNIAHELGHLFGMHHANTPKGNYLDGTSFMGKFPTMYLNSANLYFQGWLSPQNKVGWLKEGSAEFDIEPLFAPAQAGYVKAVLISKEGKDLMLSIAQFKDEDQPPKKPNGKAAPVKYVNRFALYEFEDGLEKDNIGPGSVRMTPFKEKITYKNLSFQRTAVNGNRARIRITNG